MTQTRRIVAFSLALICAGVVAHAGPINPPVGPVAPTAKPLAEVEPRTAISAANTPGDANSLFKITQPGSYYLLGNINGVAGKHGIEIAASGVTLDLNGFDLVGSAGMGAFDGVSASGGPLTNITVRNGSVRNWGQFGIHLNYINVTNTQVEGVLAADNAQIGIYPGRNGTVTRCTATGNNGGIAVPEGVVAHCSAYGNAGFGISAETVSTCSSKGNTGLGITGKTISNCTSEGNFEHGISLQGSGSATNCYVSTNGGGGAGDGITTGLGGQSVTITDCTVLNHINGMGIRGGTTSTISRCSVGLNGRGGIVVGESSTVSNCSVFENYQGTPQGNGIDVGDGSTVSGCSVRKNGPSGISCGSNCTVRENTCSNNGFNTPLGPVSGIVATGSHNRIEGNNCTDNFAMGVGGGAGIRVNGFANVIVRNTCSTGGGTGWIIAPNNICGPILDRSVPASAAINGSSAPSSLGSTDANANYTY